MTTYILTGGNDRRSAGYTERLSEQAHKYLSRPRLHILSCMFAAPREDWEMKFQERSYWFRQVFGKDVHVEMAMPDVFAEQLKAVDVVYIHGGDDVLLAHYMDAFPTVSKMFEGKVVIGSSAGANWLSRMYWTCDWRGVRQGSGITDLNIIPHYESLTYGKDDPRGPINWQDSAAELRAAIGEHKEITLLREGELVVVER